MSADALVNLFALVGLLAIETGSLSLSQEVANSALTSSLGAGGRGCIGVGVCGRGGAQLRCELCLRAVPVWSDSLHMKEVGEDITVKYCQGRESHIRKILRTSFMDGL